MPWKEIEEKLAEDNVLHTANLFAIFDKTDALVRIFNGFDELDSYLKVRASNLEAGKLEKMKLARVNCGAFELTEILNGNAEMSGASGYDVVLVSDAGWFTNPAPRSWTHMIPAMTVVTPKQA